MKPEDILQIHDILCKELAALGQDPDGDSTPTLAECVKQLYRMHTTMEFPDVPIGQVLWVTLLGTLGPYVDKNEIHRAKQQIEREADIKVYRHGRDDAISSGDVARAQMFTERLRRLGVKVKDVQIGTAEPPKQDETASATDGKSANGESALLEKLLETKDAKALAARGIATREDLERFCQGKERPRTALTSIKGITKAGARRILAALA